MWTTTTWTRGVSEVGTSDIVRQRLVGCADDRERAVVIVEEARETHRQWADHIESGGTSGVTDAGVTIAGPDERQWVKWYDLVLGVLRGPE